MVDKEPTAKQRKEWREARARLRLMAGLFPAPVKPALSPEEKRELRNQKERDRRAAKALATISLISPMFHEDGRIIRSKPTPKRPKPPQNRAKGPWDLLNRSPDYRA
jgi:hypothetical protein